MSKLWKVESGQESGIGKQEVRLEDKNFTVIIIFHIDILLALVS